MYRHAIPTLFLLLALSAPAAQADNQYEDPAGRFSVSVPEGWLAGRPSDAKIAVVMFKPMTPEIPAVCVVMGVLTAIFGGIIRDILASEPSILHRRAIYISAAMQDNLVRTAKIYRDHGVRQYWVIDVEGRLIGVNQSTANPQAGAQGIGFAIPANTVKEQVALLEKTPPRWRRFRRSTTKTG